MKSLEDKILKEGIVLNSDVLKVGSFLNQQIDVDIVTQMGDEISKIYKDDAVTKILTIEASGIAIAFAAGQKLGCPVVFAKKSKTSNVSGEVFTASVYSFTHDVTNNIIVPSQYLSSDDRVVIVDDFLANGAALEGLIEIVRQSGANWSVVPALSRKAFSMAAINFGSRG